MTHQVRRSVKFRSHMWSEALDCTRNCEHANGMAQDVEKVWTDAVTRVVSAHVVSCGAF